MCILDFAATIEMTQLILSRLRLVGLLIVLLQSSGGQFAMAQCGGSVPVGGFSADTICTEGSTTLQNSSTGAASFYWDFCADEDPTAPIADATFPTPASPRLFDMKFVQDDDGDWYGFLGYRNGLFRMDFGASLDNTPTVTDLGNPGGIVNNAHGVELAQSTSGFWYLFRVNNSPVELIRYNLDSLNNDTPTGTLVGTVAGTNAWGLTLGKNELGNPVGFISCSSSPGLIQFTFPSGITSTPTVTPFTSFGVNFDVQLFQSCGDYFLALLPVGSGGANQVRLLEYGTSLSNTPTSTTIASLVSPSFRVTSLLHNHWKLLYVSPFSPSGDVTIVDFGDTVNTTVATSSFSTGAFKNAARPVVSGSDLYLFSSSQSGGGVQRYTFSSNCGVAPAWSTNPTPSVTFTTSGTQTAVLTTVDANGVSNVSSDTTEVRFTPTAAFNFSCAPADVNLQDASSSSSPISAWEWDFGDGSGQSVLQNPTYTFAPPGPYDVELIVTAANGCSDTVVNSVSLTTPPTADFSVMNVCANDTFQVLNNSVGSTPSLQSSWLVEDSSFVENGNTFEFIPDTAGIYSFQLIVEDDDGCRDTAQLTASAAKAELNISQLLPWVVQADVSSIYPNDNITSYLWIWGDGAQQGGSPPQTHEYTQSIDTLIEAVVSTQNSCVDTLRQAVEIAFPRIVSATDSQCLGGVFEFTADANFDAYDWDFSVDDLSAPPQQVYLNTALDTATNSTTFPDNITLVQDHQSGHWHGFINTITQITRADFGASLNNPPQLTSIGDPGGHISFAISELDLVFDGTRWLGFKGIFNAQEIAVYAFDSLTDPSPQNVVYDISAQINKPRSTAVRKTATGYDVLVADYDGTELGVFQLGTDPLTSGILSAQTVNLNGNNAHEVVLAEDATGLYAFVLTRTGSPDQLLQLRFPNADLTSTPVITPLTYATGSTGSFLSMFAYNDFGRYYLGITNTNTLWLVNFDQGLNSPPQVAASQSIDHVDGADVAWDNGSAYLFGLNRSNAITLSGYRFTQPSKFDVNVGSAPTVAVSSTDTGSIQVGLRLASYAQSPPYYYLRDTTLSLPPPLIDTILAPQSVCAGENTVFSVVIAADSNGVVYDWQFPGASYDTATVSHTFSNFGLQTVELVTTGINTCIDTATTNVEVRERPQAAFNITSAACATGPVVFENASVYTSGSITLSTWDMGIGEPTFVNPGPTLEHEFVNPGAKVVSLAVLGDNGCADTTTQTLPLPSADFDISQFCAGFNTSIAPDLNYPGDPITSQTWTLPDNSSSGQLVPPDFVAPVGQATAQLVVNTQSGCEDTLVRSFNFATPPEVEIGLPEALCADELLAFVDNSTANVPVTNRRWSFSPPGDVFSTSASTQNYSFDNTGTYDVRLAVTLEGGCSDSVSTSIAIAPNPIIALPDTFLGCSGQPLQVRPDSVNNADAGANYLWSYQTDSGLFFSQLVAPGFVVDTVQERQIQLELTNAAGCTSIDSTLLRFRATPSVSVTGSPTTGNVPLVVNLTPVASAFDSLFWQFTATDTLATAQDTAQSFTFTQAGSQIVRLIANNASGCADTARLAFDLLPEIIGVWDVVLLELLPDFNTDNGQLSISALVENRSNLPLEQLTYDLRVGEISVTDSFNFAPIAPGALTTLNLPPTFGVNPYVQPAGICLRLAAPNGFADIDTTNNRLCTTLGEGLRVDAVYPSPFREALNFRAYVDPATSEQLEVSLVNMLGQTIGSWAFSEPSGTYEQSLDLLNLSEGIYYLRLRAGESEVLRTVMKR